MALETTKRKFITEEQFESLKPFNKMASKAADISGLSQQDYWFQVSFEITRDCERHGFAVLEAHKFAVLEAHKR